METRGRKLYIWFGLLTVSLAKDASQSAPGAREAESTFSEFTLVSDSKSHLFSSCFDELNTVEGTVHAIKVDEGKEYIRYLIDSDAEVTWEDVEGEDDTIACAFKAYKAGSLKFKYSNGVCSLATEGVYNPKDASCDGEEVFIIDPLDVCVTPLGTEISGHQYYSGPCETNCGSSGILTDENGDEVNPDSIPNELMECCPPRTSQCLFSSYDILPSCGVYRYCYFLGMTLPGAAPGPQLNRLKQIQRSFLETSNRNIYVNVRPINGDWYHFPDEVLVGSDEWDPDSGVPSTSTNLLVLLNADGLLATSLDPAPIYCQARDGLPECQN